MIEKIYDERGCRTDTIYNGYEGDWGGMVYTQHDNYYACGMKLRIQNAGKLGDDISWSGLQLTFCNIHDWHHD